MKKPISLFLLTSPQRDNVHHDNPITAKTNANNSENEKKNASEELKYKVVLCKIHNFYFIYFIFSLNKPSYS